MPTSGTPLGAHTAPVEWHFPNPRPGWRGGLDRFFGPGQTRAEILVHVIGIPALGLLVAALTYSHRSGLALNPWGLVVVLIFAVDGVGGVLTNSTGTAKRWYHRPRSRGERLGFVGLHAAHLTLLAAVPLGGDWGWLWLNLTILATATPVIEWTPLSVKRPVATGLAVAAVLANAVWAPLPEGLQWIPLLLWIKLLIAHLVPEAPFRDRGPVRG